MDINTAEVLDISNGWTQAGYALTQTASVAGDASGDWATAVRAAVTGYAGAWRRDISQLAAEAQTTSSSLATAANQYNTTDEAAAALMGRIQAAQAPGS